MAKSKNRRQLFQGLPIQIKYAMIMTLISGFLTLVTIFFIAWLIQRNYNLFTGDELGISAQVIQIIRHEQHILETSLLLLFLISTLTMFACTLFVTRKLTGPVVAILRQLEFYSQGNFNREFKLRQDDEFKEIEPLLNEIRLALMGMQKEKDSKLRIV